KAWDALNNSSEEQIEFIVADEEVEAIRRVYNYPNPFNESTCFQFEHNFVNRDIDIRAEIYTVKGQLVKTLFQSIKPSSSLSRDLKWDGRDDFGSPLASGVYVYRIKINAIGNGGFLETTASDLQKLVILR
ncbi:MAG: T9SS type A sorting domain-containing protein, partial [Saprospiraceae bacterium]|nr:T9SS type A sorting domain-containing protein [Saprospiraceae bacterium]